MTNKDDNFAKHCIIWMKKRKKKKRKNLKFPPFVSKMVIQFVVKLHNNSAFF